MKNSLLLIFVFLALTACGLSESAPVTEIPSIETQIPTATLASERFVINIDDNQWFTWNEQTGEYELFGEGVDSITTTAQGEIVAVMVKV